MENFPLIKKKGNPFLAHTRIIKIIIIIIIIIIMSKVETRRVNFF